MDWLAIYVDGSSYAGDYAGINRASLAGVSVGDCYISVFPEDRLVIRRRRQRRPDGTTREMLLVAVEQKKDRAIADVWLFEDGKDAVHSQGYRDGEVVELITPQLVPGEL